MPLAKDVVAIQANFIHRLQHIPGTKEEKQAYFRSRSIQVPRASYESMWASLTARLHCSGAGFDHKKVVVSSMNWSAEGVLNNIDAGVIIDNATAAGYYEKIFP